MAKRTTTSKRSIRNSNKGLTIVELLVAAAIGLVVLGIGFTLTVSSRNLVQADQDRTDANQNLRSAMELMANDIRLAGERLTGQGAPALAAVEIINGNELVLRRNVLSDTLPVCSTNITGINAILISRIGNSGDPRYPACKNETRDKTEPAPTGNGRVTSTTGTNMPDDLERWKAYKAANRNKARVYIYSPASKRGEFFAYSSEFKNTLLISGWAIQGGNGAWQNVYSMSEYSSLYMIDERRYRVRGGVLEMVYDGDQSDVLRIVNDVDKLEFRGVKADGTKVTTVGADWQTLSAVEVTL